MILNCLECLVNAPQLFNVSTCSMLFSHADKKKWGVHRVVFCSRVLYCRALTCLLKKKKTSIKEKKLLFFFWLYRAENAHRDAGAEAAYGRMRSDFVKKLERGGACGRRSHFTFSFSWIRLSRMAIYFAPLPHPSPDRSLSQEFPNSIGKYSPLASGERMIGIRRHHFFFSPFLTRCC